VYSTGEPSNATTPQQSLYATSATSTQQQPQAASFSVRDPSCVSAYAGAASKATTAVLAVHPLNITNSKWYIVDITMDNTTNNNNINNNTHINRCTLNINILRTATQAPRRHVRMEYRLPRCANAHTAAVQCAV
jgi:hypothetical protein